MVRLEPTPFSERVVSDYLVLKKLDLRRGNTRSCVTAFAANAQKYAFQACLNLEDCCQDYRQFCGGKLVQE